MYAMASVLSRGRFLSIDTSISAYAITQASLSQKRSFDSGHPDGCSVFFGFKRLGGFAENEQVVQTELKCFVDDTLKPGSLEQRPDFVRVKPVMLLKCNAVDQT